MPRGDGTGPHPRDRVPAQAQGVEDVSQKKGWGKVQAEKQGKVRVKVAVRGVVDKINRHL
ncbi:MAG TPA: hypothetical protein DD405_03595 [Desulfobacteraceae bacterium]|nr:hypothetical protein [Desulfobacteraceae bacterium]